jgi:hypothetical protein
MKGIKEKKKEIFLIMLTDNIMEKILSVILKIVIAMLTWCPEFVQAILVSVKDFLIVIL